MLCRAFTIRKYISGGTRTDDAQGGHISFCTSRRQDFRMRRHPRERHSKFGNVALHLNEVSNYQEFDPAEDSLKFPDRRNQGRSPEP
jgi:hypothetical protein